MFGKDVVNILAHGHGIESFLTSYLNHAFVEEFSER